MQAEEPASGAGGAEQIDPRGDMLKLKGDGEVTPGGLVPPYEGRTTSSSDEEKKKDA